MNFLTTLRLKNSKTQIDSVDVREEKGIRYLHFGSDWIQGAMRLSSPNALLLPYTREMMTGLLLHDNAHWPRHILQIGLGAASITKYIYHQFPETAQTIVEIDSRVAAAARQSFHLPPVGERLQLHIDDGSRWLRETSQTFDYIVIDGFDSNAQSGELNSSEFYGCAREHLNQQGILSVNILGKYRHSKKYIERIRNTFHNRMISFPSADEGNIIVLAVTGETVKISTAELRQRAAALKQRSGLDLLPVVSCLEQCGFCADGWFTL